MSQQSKRPQRRPHRSKAILRHFDPTRRLLAAVVVQALEDYLFPTQQISGWEQYEAYDFLLSESGQLLLLDLLDIPITKIRRLQNGELKRHWRRQLNQGGDL